MLRWLVLVLLVLALVGCAARTEPPQTLGPIKENAVLFLLKTRELAVLDPDTWQITHRYKLGRVAADWADTGDQILIPMMDNPEDEDAFLAVIDKTTGHLGRVKMNISPAGQIHIAEDGIAYMRTGETKGGPNHNVIGRYDIHSKTFLEPLIIPGPPDLMTSLSDGRLLIPVQRDDLTGNILVVEPKTGNIQPLFPFDLEPASAPQVIVDERRMQLYTSWPGLPKGTEVWKSWRERVSDPHLLDAQIIVYDLKTHTLVRRIFLTQLTVQNITFAPDGRILVGYLDITNTSPVKAFSIVDPQTGQVQDVPAHGNPYSLRVQGEYIYVANYVDSLVEVRKLSDLSLVKSISFPSQPEIPPDTRSLR